jgi:hypothetical protein
MTTPCTGKTEKDGFMNPTDGIISLCIFQRVICQYKVSLGLERSSAGKWLLSMCEALGSIPSTANK